MKPIDGIDLAAIVDEEEAQFLQERREAVMKQVHAIARNRRAWLALIEAKRQEISSLQAKIQKAEGKIGALRRGDWNVLSDEGASNAE